MPIGTRFHNFTTQNFEILLIYYVLHTRYHFVYANLCENRSVMAEYCYRSNDWCTIGYFSATTGFLVDTAVQLQTKQNIRCLHFTNFLMNRTPKGLFQWIVKQFTVIFMDAHFYAEFMTGVANIIAVTCRFLDQEPIPYRWSSSFVFLFLLERRSPK